MSDIVEITITDQTPISLNVSVQGTQGPAGTSNITTSTPTNITGLLYGNGTAVSQATTEQVRTAADLPSALSAYATTAFVVAGFAPLAHTHAIADVSGLQSALNGKIGGSLGSTDNRVLRADGTGGSTAQGSAVTIDDSGNVTGVNGLSVVSNGGQATFTSLFAGYVSLHFLASATNPTSTNYAFLGDASTTAINGGTQLDIRTGNVNRASFTSSLATISTNTQVNGNLTASGTVTFGGGLNLASRTKTAVLASSPATNAGRFQLSDSGLVGREVYPDGTNWRYASDDSIVT
jgi:hypothetical protein